MVAGISRVDRDKRDGCQVVALTFDWLCIFCRFDDLIVEFVRNVVGRHGDEASCLGIVGIAEDFNYLAALWPVTT